MDNKDKVAMLLQALNHLQSEYRALRKALDRQEEERLLQQWGRRWGVDAGLSRVVAVAEGARTKWTPAYGKCRMPGDEGASPKWGRRL